MRLHFMIIDPQNNTPQILHFLKHMRVKEILLFFGDDF